MNEFDSLVEKIMQGVLEKLAQPTELEKKPADKVFVIGTRDQELNKILEARNFSQVANYDQQTTLCLAQLSLARLARIAQLIPNDEEENLILKHLMNQQPVLVYGEGREYTKKISSQPYIFQKKILAFEDTWQAYGAVFLNSSRVKKRQNILTLSGVKEQQRENNLILEIPQDTIITPLAKDYLEKKQLTLKYK